LSGGANSAPQASWLDFGEGGKREKGGQGGKGGEERDKGKERGKKEKKGRREEILCSCDFSIGKTLVYVRAGVTR